MSDARMEPERPSRTGPDGSESAQDPRVGTSGGPGGPNGPQAGAQSLDDVGMLRSTPGVVYRPGTLAADMYPRCKGDNTEDWSLCAACAPA